MAQLADETAQAAADQRAVEAARELLRAPRDQALMWALVPEVALKLVEGGPGSRSSVAQQLPHSLGRAVIRAKGPTLTRVGRAVFVSTSVQHERVLAPVIASLALTAGAGRADFLPRLSPAGFLRAIRSAARVSRRISSSPGVAAAMGSGNFSEMACQTAVLLERSRRMFTGDDPPAALVVATQHGAAARAVIRGALEGGRTHVVYVPHAPTSRNAWYHDLPVHWALLRGDAEVDAYAALGVERARLQVVGDPSLASIHEEVEPSGAQVVYAVSTDDVRKLADDIRVLTDAGCEQVDVCMHPRLRHRADLRSMFPPQWTVSELPSTFARLLATAPRAVVQHGSGVGLEALSLGLPLIDLCNPGREPDYYYLTGQPVGRASSAEQLREALVRPLAPSASAERREYARRWVSDGGESAAAGAAMAIGRIAEHPVPARLLLDGWMSSAAPAARA